jgi:hypothetical protein
VKPYNQVTQPWKLLGPTPLTTAHRPFFEQLGTAREQKRKVTFQGGHFIVQQQRNQVIREVLAWLDQQLGSVEAARSTR